ncbi:DeoR/GlpR family DNA-binding transcription regulator [Subtercola boreus]|uniref:Lactose phosphotransferase system repressor n=1 Tax=Subtercola boreus TaxID=120213 RepID=A0A3E0W6N9_9MICO|nr:DeoR/GlpR family DNA-binding transcription regulator [Subtercola boreus]RFA17918.1 DeoR family transcriptional regulator [Subtercola boreus]RFA18300.1 DeoR family transcriptional regulator [Subtercola boreus]RFA24830.1 DeoR family transcriptional regulator [Subtercola boreus]
MAEIENDQQLPAPLRRERMLAVIDDRGFARVAELGEIFGVSDVTVRADLDELDRQKAIRRVHGGAVIRSRQLLNEPTFEQSIGASAIEKAQIGVLAASLVKSGQSVLLDVGSTSLAVAVALVARPELTDVVVITNGLSIALALEPAIGPFTVIVTGGTLRPRQHSLVEPLATSMLRSLHADLAFIGCNGVDSTVGVTNVNLPEAQVKRLMLESATRSVVIADRSKLGQVHLGTVGTLAEFDALVTGPGPAPDALTDGFRDAGLIVVTDRESAARF